MSERPELKCPGTTERRFRVCLITPGQLSTNPRLVREADSLVKAGFDVHVIAASFLEWADEADRSFVGRPWSFEAVAFGPRAPRWTYARQTVIRKLARAVWRVLPFEWLAGYAHHPAYPDLLQRAVRRKADLYVAHNLAALPVATRAASRNEAVASFDAEDSHLAQLPTAERRELEGRVTRMLEERGLRRCVFVTASSPGIAETYAREYGIRKPEVFPNVMPLSHRPSNAASRDPGAPSLFWFSQTVGPGRGLETAVRAIAISRSRPLLRLLGRRDEKYAALLTMIAAELGVADRIRFERPVPPREVPGFAALSDAGLAGEEAVSENNDIAWSNKVFTYLLAGRPTLASDTRGQRELADLYPEALLLYRKNDPEDLARVMDVLFRDREELAKRKCQTERLVETCACWEAWEGRWLEGVRRALTAGSATERSPATETTASPKVREEDLESSRTNRCDAS